MKNKLLLAVGSMALLTACDASKGNEMAWFDHAVKTSGHQLLYMAEQLMVRSCSENIGTSVALYGRTIEE